MKSTREDHQEGVRKQAQRSLNQLGRRWPTEPSHYLLAVAVAAFIVLLLALL